MFPDTSATLHTLDNGLKIILDPNPSAPVISTQIWVATGSIHEDKWMGAGISHLLEHMVFKGTASFTGDELSQTVQAAGGQWNAYTSFDRTVYYIDGPADSAETFLKALSEMVFQPTFPIDEFEKEKDVIRREIDMYLDDPGSKASTLLFTSALADDGRAQPVIGHLELFNQIGHADMVAYHKAHYTTENCFLSIAGDFETHTMLELLNSLLGSTPRSFTHIPRIQTAAPQLGKRLQRDTFAVAVSKLSLAWRTPNISHPDAAALELFSVILGGGRSSRLYQNLREKRGLCQHISSGAWITQQDPGLFCINAEVPTDQRDDLELAIYNEIEALSHAHIDDELEKAKRITHVNQLQTLTTASGRASDLASNWHEARNLNYTKDYLNQIEEITVADLRRVCKTYLLTSHNLTVTSLDPLNSDNTENNNSSAEKTTQARNITTHTLSNGLTLHLAADPRLPMVSIQSALLAGSASETPENAGISTLLSSLLTKGTSSRSGAEIANSLAALGATLGASSANSTASLSASCLSQDIDTVLEIFADCFANPAFHQDAIDFEKKTIISALLEQDEDPVSLAFRTLRHSLFGGTGYGLPQLGTPQSIQSITRLGISAHHSLYYNASNTQIAIFGDIDITATIDLAEKHLGKIRTGSKQTPPLQTKGKTETINLTLDKQQAVLTLGYPAADIHSADTAALSIIDAWCSDMAGPLFSKIREELGLAYFVSSTLFRGFDAGMLGFYLGTSADQIELAKTELLNTINSIAQNGIDPKTLESVKTSWLASRTLANQSNNAMARLCAVDTTLGFSTDNYLILEQKVKALTADDIKTVAHKYLSQTPSIVEILPNESTN